MLNKLTQSSEVENWPHKSVVSKRKFDPGSHIILWSVTTGFPMCIDAKAQEVEFF